MALLQDLIQQIDDPELRDRISKETDKLVKQKKFGLVFEEHLPECTPLYEMPIKVGSKVAKKTGYVNDIYTVISIDDNVVECDRRETHELVEFQLDELVVVAEFGDPIYPCLKYIDSVENAPDSDLWHTLIEADNYHALQLLEYLYAGKVDCIYIDPPYNTGAKDWKYNNDYVDSSDRYQHSKWLSFIERRLLLAKKLLNPIESVLIVTIDDKEYLHLGCLLEEIFPEANIQMISDVINPKGTMQRKIFPRTDEYIFYVWIGKAVPQEQELSSDWLIGNSNNTKHNRYRWQPFVRANISRRKTPTMFYPIFVNKKGDKVLRVGKSLNKDEDRKSVICDENEIAIFPINKNGEEAIWHLSQESFLESYKRGYIRLNGFNENGMGISYLSAGMQEKLNSGVLPVIGKNNDGSVIFDIKDYRPEFVPGTQWRIKSHDATEHGTKLLQNIIGKRFSYPKALYSTADSIRFFVSNKPDALILDFFAGSGTTLHAVNLLNAEDNGRRRCIIVTNNEISSDEEKKLIHQGINPNDDAWEKLGIANYVTWPRTICSIKGIDINGNELSGSYVGNNIPMKNGFKSNAIFFKLSFLDKTSVALGRQFKELLSTIWMKAGAIGKCPIIEGDNIPDLMVLPQNKMAILINEANYFDFNKKLANYPEIKTLFIVTDSESAYKQMIKNYDDKECYQLYRDYLDNFRINTGR